MAPEMATAADFQRLFEPAARSVPVLPRAAHIECPPGKACATCESNRKWDRIYHEKFEDPDYYAETRGRASSPLSDL